MKVKHLSKQDAIILLELIYESLACTSQEQVQCVIGKLQSLVPYQAATSCISRIAIDGTVEEIQIVNVDYPMDYLAELVTSGLIWHDPAVIEHFRHKRFELQHWSDFISRPLQSLSREMLDIISLAEDFGFNKLRSGCGYSHGVCNQKKTEGSLFAFHGLRRSDRTEEILGLIIPHLHEAIRRVTGISKIITSPAAKESDLFQLFSEDGHSANGSSLTPKETEVLKWVKQGKSTWDISTILGISERTVKFHVGNIMQKLDAVTRTHAVAKAIELGMLDIE